MLDFCFLSEINAKQNLMKKSVRILANVNRSTNKFIFKAIPEIHYLTSVSIMGVPKISQLKKEKNIEKAF